MDQLTPRGEGEESPDSTSHMSGDQRAQTTTLQPEGPGEKTVAVAKLPKSVSAGALSLMIPGGKFKNTQKYTKASYLCQHKILFAKSMGCFTKLKQRHVENYY